MIPEPPKPPPTRVVIDGVNWQALKCLIGLHQYGAWEDVPYPNIGLDPALFFWPMSQEKRECQCCGKEDWREMSNAHYTKTN